MDIQTDGLIIRENNNVGEADRFVSILTRDNGLVQASARGAQKMKSRNSGVTRLLSFGRFTLHAGRSFYIIGEVEPLRSFFDLYTDMDNLALAQYFCELCGILAPHEESSEDMLRLMLLGLTHLTEHSRPSLLVKCVMEQRLLALGGYTPDVTACCRCSAADISSGWFSIDEGRLYCNRCAPSNGSYPLSAGMLAALRHIHTTPLTRTFGFSVADETLRKLAEWSEAFVLHQLGRGFHTLQFYHSLQHFSTDKESV